MLLKLLKESKIMEKLRFEIPSIERKKDALEYIKEFIDNNSKIK